MIMTQGYAVLSGGNRIKSYIKESGILAKHTLVVPPHLPALYAYELHEGKPTS